VEVALCAVRSCVILSRSCSGVKKKSNFTDELKNKYSCSWNCLYELKTECFVFKPGRYTSVANKGALDLRANAECEKNKKAVKGETSSAKETYFLLHRETNQMMLYERQKVRLHFILWNWLHVCTIQDNISWSSWL